MKENTNWNVNIESSAPTVEYIIWTHFLFKRRWTNGSFNRDQRINQVLMIYAFINIILYSKLSPSLASRVHVASDIRINRINSIIYFPHAKTVSRCV